jgi:hypothetical protein
MEVSWQLHVSALHSGHHQVVASVHRTAGFTSTWETDPHLLEALHAPAHQTTYLPVFYLFFTFIFYFYLFYIPCTHLVLYRLQLGYFNKAILYIC